MKKIKTVAAAIIAAAIAALGAASIIIGVGRTCRDPSS